MWRDSKTYLIPIWLVISAGIFITLKCRLLAHELIVLSTYKVLRVFSYKLMSLYSETIFCSE